MTDHYQVGGSLAIDFPFHISRQADRELLEYLQNGDFCYVFNSCQMGKSSLLVRISNFTPIHRLLRSSVVRNPLALRQWRMSRQQGWQTATTDITAMGSEMITTKQLTANPFCVGFAGNFEFK